MEAILFLVLIGVIMFVAFGFMTISYEVERRAEIRLTLEDPIVERQLSVEKQHNGDICCAA
ncbi:hypothetical protein [Ktedonospora formicarum]|uniref:Uncharacterized protein n=1 Tax=Ktedonospora formicarum TaxID=2778364 RepID=A0A8J3MS17_9CHLR|nr:hypothetical protein [Ktedonospora formicarum]GHO46647.1 hypothetical protein KSX_48100 [Ktedonospora formicarum]